MSSVPRETVSCGVRVSSVGQLRSVDVRGVGLLRGVPVRGVPLRGVRVGCVHQLRGVRSALALPDGLSHQSPREVLSVAMQELRRAAGARKFSRVARRLAALAEGRSERVTWSSRTWPSRKSLRGVC